MDKKETTLLFYNAKIWVSGSLDENTWFAFNAKSGRVINVGKDPHPSLADFDKAFDAGKRRIFPGFHDSHIHVTWVGIAHKTVDLKGCRSVKDMQNRIKDYIKSHPDKQWIIGGQWEEDLLDRYPDKSDLDCVCGDKPVMMASNSHHIKLVNSHVLKLVGITKNTANPDGGKIQRYPAGHVHENEPTGILVEGPAIDLADKVWLNSPESKQDTLSWIKAGLDICLRYGLTSVHSNEDELWNEYCELADKNQLPIRVFTASFYSGKDSGNFPQYPGESRGDFLSCDRVKLFADGALGDSTAALSQDYKCSHTQHGRGVLIYSQEKLNELVREATNAGFRLEIHVIGDQAAEAAMTAIEYAQVAPEKRPILTHCQILREDLIPRMRKHGVIANIQPQFVTTDSRWVPKLLPDSLLKWAYAWKSLLKNGIVCAGGSDAPIEVPNPFLGIYDAIFRPYGDRDSKQSFMPEEKLSVQEAIDLYTKSGAYTTFREQDLGQLLPGYLADFVVLEGTVDPVEVPEHFKDAKPEQVWVAGKRVL